MLSRRLRINCWVLKKYNVDSKKTETNIAFGNTQEISIPAYLASNNVAKKASFFGKIRSIFNKK